MNHISIRHLRAFIEVAKEGSFTKAANNLHITQSTLTATIKQLEEQAGLTLFDRTTRRVFLSGVGEHFYPVFEKLISDFDTAFDDIHAAASQLKGKIGIAASPSIIGRILPTLIKRYHEEFPHIDLSLHDDNASGIESRVLDNQVDFGIGGNHSSHPELVYQPILSDQYGVILPANSELADQYLLLWQDVIHLPQLHLTEDTGTRTEIAALIEQFAATIKSQTAHIEVSTTAGLAEMIRSGLGISFLPALAASTSAFAGLKFIPLSAPVLNRDIYIISRKNRALSPAAEHLRKQLITYTQHAELPNFVYAVPDSFA